ncbi:lipoate--protein ligase [Aminiphilus sp.]|uniref:lipoate--protein ligase n=1 Tax=Aminiphilus sp. TaxID=1872488 RepID=UPI00260AA324|nr:lipoate--protein ligase [Aminiphilus sp.]
MRKIRTIRVTSPSHDPWWNLALEEYLLDRVEDGTMILYLWQNDRTVVIGRNQNAWRECRTELLEAEDGRLARRLSGGGAVYHDLGNCNFTFLATPKTYDFLRQVKVVLDALRSLGVAAEFGGRNDITVEGRKISGNAFYRGASGRFHHGTILVSVEMERMARYLQPSKAKLVAKGVTSVRSRVANLCELRPVVTVADVRDALQRAFSDYFGPGEILDASAIFAESAVAALREKYASRSLIYGKTPAFDLEMEHRFGWGEVQLGMTVKDGVVSECRLFTDALDAELLRSVECLFVGLVPEAKVFAERLRSANIACPAPEVRDVLGWLESQELELL